MRLLISVLACLAAAPLTAQTSPARQTSPATIAPGMTQAQVVAALGVPLSARRYDGHTYLFYKNGCEKTCGMNDIVVLDGDKVVDAVFRSPARRYSGVSSSPKMITASEAKHGSPAPPLKTRATPATPATPATHPTPPKKPAT